MGIGHLVEQDLQQQLLRNAGRWLPALGEAGCEVDRCDQEVLGEADVEVMRESWRQRTENLQLLDGIGVDAIAKLDEFAEVLEKLIDDRDRRAPEAAGKDSGLAPRRGASIWAHAVIEHTKHLDVDPDQTITRRSQIALQLGSTSVPLSEINAAFRYRV